MAKPKTAAQLRRIFGLGTTVKMSKSDLEDLAFDVSRGRTERLSKLTFEEANGLIVRLGGDAFPVSRSRRTRQYHRQLAGVQKLVSGPQRTYLDSLRKGRGISDEGFEKMCVRTIGMPKPRTTKEANIMIEALKSMNKRDRKPKAEPGREEAA